MAAPPAPPSPFLGRLHRPRTSGPRRGDSTTGRGPDPTCLGGQTVMKCALSPMLSADNLKDATVREVERIARELLKRGGK
ncbi:conserved hypothetical protein [Parafrankia sp. Ea1.12]|nr:conserved hypothetical protein [Parafrankia sp. Ea1.12]